MLAIAADRNQGIEEQPIKTGVEKAARANINNRLHTSLSNSHDISGCAFLSSRRRLFSSSVQSGTMESSSSDALLNSEGVWPDISVGWVVLSGEMGYWKV